MDRISLVLLGALILSACAPAEQATVSDAAPATDGTATGMPSAEPTAAGVPQAGQNTDELGDPLSSYDAITQYNNYYEFSMDKQAVAGLSKDFKTTPWTVAVGGLVNKPKMYDIDDLRTKYTQQERIYRMRCVEGWSMVFFKIIVRSAHVEGVIRE